MQQSFVENPTLSQQLFELLDVVFPDLGLSQIAHSVRALGTSWEAVSTPFMCLENGKAIAHVGVLELPLWIAGKPVTVGAIHGVCVHPDYRRRGYYRQCMTAALKYYRDRYQTLILTTGQPALYEPFGFRVMPEHAFTASCNSRSTHNGFRVLNLQAANDQQILHRLLQDRRPVSQILGVLPEETVFLFNEIYIGLTH
jgi:predicted N-acetyltransferase YhbS